MSNESIPTPPTRLSKARSGLDAIFEPRSVALVGATEKQGSVGRIIMQNLLHGRERREVYPVNPKRPGVLDVPAFPNITAIGKQVDLAIIVTPSRTVPGIVRECGEAGVKGLIIISAGFKEIGPEGVKLEQEILADARRYGMRIIGPNCLGVQNPGAGLNATFGSSMGRPGKVSFISQSGALCTAVLDWSLQANVGFSRFVSIGSMLDVGWGDLIDYLGNDVQTKAILLYMETIGDARAFLSAAREVALTKPIIVIKPGRTEAAAKAAVSHTGSLAGSDDALTAAFRRAGVLRVDEIAELFSMAEVLGKQPLPKGSRLTILTNAGGPGVLATDALVGAGASLAPISDETMKELDGFLPSSWSRNNPVDILGDADPERYRKSLEIAIRNEESDGLMVILTPQAMTDPTETAEEVRKAKLPEDKPVLTSWMGAEEVSKGKNLLNESGIPSFSYPDAAARAFATMHRYGERLEGMYETPVRPAWDDQKHKENFGRARTLIGDAQKEDRTLLTEAEAKELLGAYDIPVTPTLVATSPDEAVKIAEDMGYPVVLKLHSKTVTHKTDVGGVKLNLQDAEAVKQAFAEIESGLEKAKGPGHFDGATVQPMVKKSGYEIIVGSSIDQQLGPVLLFGSGGELVEVYRDRALGLPPLNSTQARRMIEQTTIYKALLGVRGRKPVDLDELAQIMVRFSYLVVDHPEIKEIDINPMIAGEDTLLALDARVVLYTSDEQIPTPAIRPYPVQYVNTCQLKDGAQMLMRPIRAEDEPLLVKFHEGLSERSVVQRYFYNLKLEERVTHERLVRACHVDYDREMVLVAERGEGEAREILGGGRLSRSRLADDQTAEFAIIVSDKHQNKGLGTCLLSRLIEVARKEGLTMVQGYILQDNAQMRHLCEKLGFTIEPSAEDGVVLAKMSL